MTKSSERSDERSERAAALSTGATAPQRQFTRRQWLKRTTWGGFAVAAGVIVDTFYIEPHWLEIVRRDLPIRILPAHWQGKLLVHISDVHVGHRVSDDYLIRSFERVAPLGADVVVVTGDFVSCHRQYGGVPVDKAVKVYRHLPRGKTATLGIPGNHDYGMKWSDLSAAAKVESILSDAGLKMLRNESIDLDGLTIVGLDDLWAKQCDGSAAFSGTSADTARLALCHNPDAADHDLWERFQGWILSGHTHGGQCKPPFLSPPQLPVVNRRYTAGEFQLDGNRKMYINRGLGHLLPVRFNCRPEVTVFRLTAE
jgi:predicted MPP superfamily phosphohydrolase